MADDDGVVIVPKKLAVETAQKAQKRFDDEDAQRRKLAAGVLGLDMYNMREPLAKAGLVTSMIRKMCKRVREAPAFPPAPLTGDVR